jgi:hypothetical protein
MPENDADEYGRTYADRLTHEYGISGAARMLRAADTFGITRAPGESDENLNLRILSTLINLNKPVFTAAFVYDTARAQSWWIKYVQTISHPERGEVEVRVRGPLMLPVPRRLRRRVSEVLDEVAPANVLVRVSQ